MTSELFTCQNGEQIPYYQKNVRDFLHRTTALFGPSETGKTTIIREILFLLKDVIPILVVIAPSDQSNEAYSSVVPPQCIHDDFNIDVIKKVYERQKIACKVYNDVNRLELLMSLFKMVPNKDKEIKLIHIINSKFTKYVAVLKNNASKENRGDFKRKVEKAKDSRNESIRIVLKNSIRIYRHYLAKLDLTKPQQYALKYLDFNPEVLLILDDCADEFKKHNNDPIIRMLFYKARHFKITFIISFQDDKDLDSSLRKGSHIKIFTNSNVAGTYFRRPANGFTPEQRKKLDKYVNSVYTEDDHNYEKLMYIRASKEPYQVLLADEYEFKFGSDKMWQMASRAPPPEESLNKDNPFYDSFQI